MKSKMLVMILVIVGSLTIGVAYGWVSIGTQPNDVYVNNGNKIGFDGGTGNNYISQSSNIITAFSQALQFHASSNSAGNFNLISGYNPGSNNQEIGGVNFEGYDSGSSQHNYAQYQGTIENNSPTNIQGALRFYVYDSSSPATQYMTMNFGGGGRIDAYKPFAVQYNVPLYLDGGFSSYMLSTSANGPIYIYSNGVNTMTVNNGQVGIGTTSPAQKLHVSGNIGLSGNIVPTNNNDICIGSGC